MQSTCRTLCFTTSCEISIGIKMWLNVRQFVTYPPDQSMTFRVEDIAHQALELAIAFRCPFSDILGKVTYCPQQVKSSQARSPEE